MTTSGVTLSSFQPHVGSLSADGVFPIKKPVVQIFSRYSKIFGFNTDTDVSSSDLFFVSMMKIYTKTVSNTSHAM